MGVTPNATDAVIVVMLVLVGLGLIWWYVNAFHPSLDRQRLVIGLALMFVSGSAIVAWVLNAKHDGRVTQLILYLLTAAGGTLLVFVRFKAKFKNSRVEYLAWSLTAGLGMGHLISSPFRDMPMVSLLITIFGAIVVYGIQSHDKKPLGLSKEEDWMSETKSQ